MTDTTPPLLKRSMGSALLILFGLFIAGLCIAMFFQVISPFSGQVATLYWGSAAQNLFAFIGVALFTAYLVSARPMYMLALNVAPTWRAVIGVAIFYIVAIPAMNQIIYWNAEMHLPKSMSAIEELMRQMEDSAGDVTDILLSSSSIWGLVAGIFFVGILTGFSEEIIFRGTLQRILGSRGAKISAIWISAFLFSAVHFQFFGFFPRLLLGAWFGYLLVWTRSLYVPAIAHALNNSLVVVTYWLNANGMEVSDAEKWGLTESGIPWMAIGSAMVFFGLLMLTRNYFFSPKHKGEVFISHLKG